MDAKYKRGPERLGAYEIIRPLARGGMAELFLARAIGPEGFEKIVVLKRVLPHFAENPRFVRSFLDEAKLVAGFDHPNIAHVYDMGMADGSYFFTMEYVQGVDLRSILKRCARDGQPLPIALAILIARNVASALHYAHERRNADGKLLDVVHRDVSPSNIIVCFDGGPKLIDFGIAKAASSSLKTQTGALKGKISYMSPEQAKGAAIDRRTDVFALGIVLWEMLTCRRLYKSDNDMATIQRIIYEAPPSPRSARPDLPPPLERIVLRALALDIGQRYQTAQELEADLEEFAHEHRIKQSTIELNAYMQRVFADELKAANEAHAGAQTVTDAQAYPDDATQSDSNVRLTATGDDDETGDLPAASWPDPAQRAAELDSAQDATTPHLSAADFGAAPEIPALRRRARWPWVAGLAALAVGAAFGARELLRDDEPAPGTTVAPAVVPPPSEPAAAEPVVVAPPPVVETPPAVEASPSGAPPPAVETPAAAKKKAKPVTAKPKKGSKRDEPREEPKSPPEMKQQKPPPEPKPFDPNAVFPPSP